MPEISTLESWIVWWWDDDWSGLDECSEEHIWNAMQEGYTSGELCRTRQFQTSKDGDYDDEEIRGGWERRKD